MIERELTAHERKEIRELVLGHCANIDKQIGECRPLECRCPMLDLQINTAVLCRCFKNSILPECPNLQAIFEGTENNLKVCPLCGQKFHVSGRQKYCHACQEKARKIKAAQRNRKYRQKA